MHWIFTCTEPNGFIKFHPTRIFCEGPSATHELLPFGDPTGKLWCFWAHQLVSFSGLHLSIETPCVNCFIFFRSLWAYVNIWFNIYQYSSTDCAHFQHNNIVQWSSVARNWQVSFCCRSWSWHTVWAQAQPFKTSESAWRCFFFHLVMTNIAMV